ncbi:MAG: hypothetical protein KatS3mg105_0610 [Gemmatales bacterium]|nr:MAG: hypothetical protein KatS3mg105_0610 [Gemmatales bacterium]
MARIVKPDRLTMNLFAPGMSVLHRAGLGGLACTLKAMERQAKNGLLPPSKLPAPFDGDKLPWDIDEQSVTLKFGKPENAKDYLKKLFEFAFTIRKDGLIFLPGQHTTDPSAAVLADLQTGLTLTFLQHGKVRKLVEEATSVSYDPEGEGVPGVLVEYRKCTSFKHQIGWKDFVDRQGCLVTGNIKVDGPISPGTVVRHAAYSSDTAAKDPPERMLPLYFAIVGTLALPVNRGVAALLVPDVNNLLDFIYDRPSLTPTTAIDCQVANAADGALRAQIRLRNDPIRASHIRAKARKAMAGSEIPGCYAMTFTPTSWANQQKSRVATIFVPPSDDKRLDRFSRALAHLPPRVQTRTLSERTGKGRRKTVSERPEVFRVDSVIRPLIAENLALGRLWYAGFARLMTAIDPATRKPYRDRILYERKGLHDMMADQTMWEHAREETIVRAVHEALRSRYGQIAEENKNNPAARKNRWKSEYDRWRLAFAGAKTANQFRRSLCDLFSRAGNNPVLKEHWQDILPLLRADCWQQARDLALLGLCSYAGRGDSEVVEPTDSTN